MSNSVHEQLTKTTFLNRDSYRSQPKDKKKKQETVSDEESLESDDDDEEDDLGDEELAAEFQQEMEGLDMDNDDSDVGNDLSDADEQLRSEFADNDHDFDEDGKIFCRIYSLIVAKFSSKLYFSCKHMFRIIYIVETF